MPNKERVPDLRVAVIGFDERAQATLEMIFKGPGRGCCVLADEASADVTVADLDQVGAADHWAAHRKRFPTRPAIVVSLTDQEVPGTLFLRKPLRVDAFLAALATLRKSAVDAGVSEPAGVSPSPAAGPAAAPARSPAKTPEPVPLPRSDLRERGATSARAATRALDTQAAREPGKLRLPDLDPNDPDGLKNAFYQPDHTVACRLLAWLTASVSDSVAREIRLAKDRASVLPGRAAVLPVAREVLTDLRDHDIHTLAFLPYTGPEIEVRELDERDPVALRRVQDGCLRDCRRIPLETFAWGLALHVARGRVPAGTALDAPMAMRRWPNLTRLAPTPNALRIAALWARQPRSLLDMARALDVPLAHVLAFYSAAQAIDLMTSAKRQVDTLVEPAPVETHHRRGLLGRILAKLRGSRDEGTT